MRASILAIAVFTFGLSSAWADQTPAQEVPPDLYRTQLEELQKLVRYQNGQILGLAQLIGDLTRAQEGSKAELERLSARVEEIKKLLQLALLAQAKPYDPEKPVTPAPR